MPRRRVVRVLSRDARFQRAQTLKTNRTKRRRAGVCFVEGVLPLNAALRAGLVESIWYPADRRLSDWATAALAGVDAERVELPGALLDELSDRADGVELAALVRIPAQDFDATAAAGVTVLLDRPTSPGNIGTIARSGAALGAARLVIAGHAADAFDPKSIAASRGAVFHLPVVEIAGAAELIRWRDAARTAGAAVRIAGASAAGADAVPLAAADLADPIVIILGNEAVGIGRGLLDCCDLIVQIPTDGAVVDSLNVGVAAGIMLYEIARQHSARRVAPAAQ